MAEGTGGRSLPFLAGPACGGGGATDVGSRGVVCICGKWRVSCACVGVLCCGCWSVPFPVVLVCVCVLRFAVCWCGCCVEFVCAGLAACVWVCVRCVSSGVRVLWYVIPVLVHVVRQHGHDKRDKTKSCKSVVSGWVGGRAFGLLSLSLTFAWCLSPLPLLCLLLVPAECRGAEGRGATRCVVVHSVLCLALPACCRLCSVVCIAWFAALVR